MESDRRAALAAVYRFERELRRFPWKDAPAAVRLTPPADPNRPPVEVVTTPAREPAFVLSHTAHHNALIAVLAAAVGASVPAGFGCAPATAAYQNRRALPCAC